ncbi:DNA polymerase III subunit delta' [Candidatus Pantoea edessiphila]|uniref:DNA polymerase III subunit delta' n=1 Tax=Candidatus Pantoea edessiphila TaxID=2044610 RepID=A0A2P5T0L4_9GAMM|nr:DNA polymerase III subunit delta' C-terminal domain-containing protein [Candidatus Pantoea edessiphila]PPI88106.1 DNA polymerase III subunit delta' [Candidatus Pantoea edessiphila]
MKYYPWLHQTYLNKINQYNNGFFHPVTLIQGNQGIGKDILIWNLGCWLLCYKPDNLKHCDNCNSCYLMKLNIHPDYYVIEEKQKDKTIGVDIIRNLISNIYKCVQQGKKRIIFIRNIDKLTQSASNALLKIIEEPPIGSWFFFSTHNISKVTLTIRSRCTILHLLPPSEENGLLWLKSKSSQSKNIILSALRLSTGIPPTALNLIENHLPLRKRLYDTLLISLKYQILNLLPILHENENMCITWLISLILDAMKLQNNITNKLTNIDRKDVVLLLSRAFSFSSLIISIHDCINCRNRLMNVIIVNRELLLTDFLLNWVKISKFHSIDV